MDRPATWKVVTLGAALTGLSAAGVGVAQKDSGPPGSGPVSPAPLYNDERLLASGSGGGACWNGYIFTACVQGPGWVDWNLDWVHWNPGWGHWGHWGHGHGHGF